MAACTPQQTTPTPRPVDASAALQCPSNAGPDTGLLVAGLAVSLVGGVAGAVLISQSDSVSFSISPLLSLPVAKRESGGGGVELGGAAVTVRF